MGALWPIFLLGAAGLVLVGVAALLLRRRADPLDRLRPQAGPSQDRAALRSDAGSDRLERYADFLEPKSAEELSAAKLWLQRAGYTSPTAVRSFHATQFGLAVGLLVAGLLYVMMLRSNGAVLGPAMQIGYVMGPGLFGYYAPRRWVQNRVNVRMQQIQDGFPDALDMMLVCVEAGQSLDQAIVRVARELRDSCPVLAEELETVAQEIKAGLDKSTVLRNFGTRTGVTDVMSFVTVMIQSQQFGTSIGEALRLYAADMRDKRMMRAEEAANKVPTKMTLGTMLFTVPPLLIILVGPSVHGMMENFTKLGGN